MTEARGRAEEFLAGGGEMGCRMREFDWSMTPLGPISGWPRSLKDAVRLLLNNRFPMFVWWGPELISLYNDAYSVVLGGRHPASLGQPAAEVWREIWDVVGPQAEAVMAEARATWNEERLLVMERNGFTEETYFTWSYSPLADDHGRVGGVFCTCTEDTQRVLGRRRLRTLRELAARTNEETRTVGDACRAAARILAGHPEDLPFALIYLVDADARTARLAGCTGLPEGSPAAAARMSLAGPGDEPDAGWPLSAVATAGDALVVTDLARRFGPLPVAGGLGRSRPGRPSSCRSAARGRIGWPASWSPGSAPAGRSTTITRASSTCSPATSPPRWPTPAPTRTSGAGPRRWRSSTAPRPRSSPTSATSSAPR